MSVYVRYQPDGGVTIQTPYHKEFIDDLKDSVPYLHREWRAEEKLWFVDAVYAKNAEDLCKNWFDDVRVSGEPKSQAGPRESVSGNSRPVEPWATLHLLPTAPDPVVEGAYKALMRLNHPDTGGENKKAQQINAAYDSLKKLRK